MLGKFFLLILLALLVIVVECHSVTFVAKPSWRLLQRIRGGGDDDSDTVQQPTMVLCVGEIAGADWRKAIVYSSNGYTREANVPQQNALEALSITTDVIVLKIDMMNEHETKINIPMDFSSCILAASRQRQDAGYPKPTLFILLETNQDSNNDEDDDESTVEIIKSELLLRDFRDLTPSVLERFDILTSKQELVRALADMHHYYKDNPESNRVCQNDEEYFMAMLQQVHRSLSGKSHEKIQFTQILQQQDALEIFKEVDEKQLDENDSVESLPDSNNPKTTELLTSTEEQESIVARAQRAIQDLKSQQEDVWLNIESRVPILNFGSEANQILQTTMDSFLPKAVSQNGTALQQQHPQQWSILVHIAGEVRELYDNQLQALREHYGIQYETAIDEAETEQAKTVAAERYVQAFRTAAQQAIPNLCQSDQVLVDAADFSYLQALQGLMQDMMVATQQQEQQMAMSEDEEEEEEEKGRRRGRKRKRPSKWYEKLAARAITLGFNYIQGWLAWQGIKRAAAQRDRELPKFPLF